MLMTSLEHGDPYTGKTSLYWGDPLLSFGAELYFNLTHKILCFLFVQTHESNYHTRMDMFVSGLLQHRTFLWNSSSTQISRKLICPHLIPEFPIVLRFLQNVKHRYYCVLRNWNGCYELSRFYDIDAFGMDVLYCSRPGYPYPVRKIRI